jgi:hypothetical protein
MIGIACPYLCGRPEDRREGTWLETMDEAQTGQPGRKQFIRLGLHMTGEWAISYSVFKHGQG